MQNKQGGKRIAVFNGCDRLIQKSKSKPDIERRLLYALKVGVIKLTTVMHGQRHARHSTSCTKQLMVCM